MRILRPSQRSIPAHGVVAGQVHQHVEVLGARSYSRVSAASGTASLLTTCLAATSRGSRLIGVLGSHHLELEPVASTRRTPAIRTPPGPLSQIRGVTELRRGIYEQLVTAGLEQHPRALDPALVVRGPLDPADAHDVIARHLAFLARRALRPVGRPRKLSGPSA